MATQAFRCNWLRAMFNSFNTSTLNFSKGTVRWRVEKKHKYIYIKWVSHEKACMKTHSFSQQDLINIISEQSIWQNSINSRNTRYAPYNVFGDNIAVLILPRIFSQDTLTISVTSKYLRKTITKQIKYIHSYVESAMFCWVHTLFNFRLIIIEMLTILSALSFNN